MPTEFALKILHVVPADYNSSQISDHKRVRRSLCEKWYIIVARQLL
ncbi:hypothetical protein PHOSAC3_90187 [Mesotoga infera]|nr:hypothetical protein PHOSAC3_90187 [Mesotoga infera]